ncbi:hypothetical protein GQ457_10G012170 [Hibiscus cannabinus]
MLHLSVESEDVIEEAVPNDPGANAPRADKDKFKKHIDDMLDVCCLMLATMTPELQKQHEDMVAYEMIQNLKEIYEGQARQERYETSKALFQCKMSEGSPVGAHVIKMMGYIQRLEKLSFALNDELAINVVLQSLPDSFSQFILNFNMNEIEKTLPQLLGMLRTTEGNMKKGGSKSVLMVCEVNGKGKGKKVAKSKGNGKTKPKGKEALKPKGGVSKDGKCFHCGKTGHWKRNCLIYLEDVKKAKAVGASISGIYVIDVHMSTSSSWVLDTGCGSHICTSVQGLHTRRTLAKGDVDLRVGNGARVVALAVGTYLLSLPSGLILNLENCYFVPSLTKNIIYVSCLDKIGFEIIIKNNSCSFFYDSLFYGSAQLINGLYILNQENMIFNVNTKRLKTNDSNQTYLWHCRLGHISERCISKLHKDGLLDHFIFEQLDVCGPMNTQARGGYQYFIMFTDDFSKYGYIYLMLHKSESLEKFKEFKNEVQNQHGKSIKALRSDQGGKECGIVSQLTPPGTPQWNGVSERRNRTLLDIVLFLLTWHSTLSPLVLFLAVFFLLYTSLYLILLFLAIWAIWGHRNKVVHDHATFDLPSFINFIKSYMNDMDILPPIAISPVLSLEEKWFPPCLGLVKVNFDAAFVSATSSSFSGIIFRDSAGVVLAAGCFSHHNVLNTFAAEALACYQALVLAHDLSYMRIVLEGVSLSVIKKFRHFSEDRSFIGMLIKAIKRKIRSFDSTTVLFYPRACNKPAHYIAHLRHSTPTPCIWIGNVPHQVDQLAIKDKWWTDPPNLFGINL